MNVCKVVGNLPIINFLLAPFCAFSAPKTTALGPWTTLQVVTQPRSSRLLERCHAPSHAQVGKKKKKNICRKLRKDKNVSAISAKTSAYSATKKHFTYKDEMLYTDEMSTYM